MLQGLICILLFVAIVIHFLLVTICLFGHLVIVSFASAIGLSVVTNRYTLHNSSELLSVGVLLRPLAALGIVQASLTLLSFAQGFLGVHPISGDCKERVTLCSGFSGEKRPEWVIRAKP